MTVIRASFPGVRFSAKRHLQSRLMQRPVKRAIVERKEFPRPDGRDAEVGSPYRGKSGLLGHAAR